MTQNNQTISSFLIDDGTHYIPDGITALEISTNKNTADKLSLLYMKDLSKLKYIKLNCNWYIQDKDVGFKMDPMFNYLLFGSQRRYAIVVLNEDFDAINILNMPQWKKFVHKVVISTYTYNLIRKYFTDEHYDNIIHLIHIDCTDAKLSLLNNPGFKYELINVFKNPIRITSCAYYTTFILPNLDNIRMISVEKSAVINDSNFTTKPSQIVSETNSTKPSDIVSESSSSIEPFEVTSDSNSTTKPSDIVRNFYQKLNHDFDDLQKRMDDFSNKIAQRLVNDYISNDCYRNKIYHRVEVKYDMITEMVNICRSFGKNLELFMENILNKIINSLNDNAFLIDVRLVKEKLEKVDGESMLTYYYLTDTVKVPQSYMTVKFNRDTFPDNLASRLYIEFEKLN